MSVADVPDVPEIPDIQTLIRIQVEFLEMPDLKLTAQQAQRLWQLPVRACDSALGLLVERGFLARSRDGRFVRRGAASILV